MSAPQVGQIVSHYRISGVIGGGGMGMVYKAVDTRLDRVVALKFLPQHLLEDERAKRRFMVEAKSASVLDHPNIGTIYEIDETPDEGLFIAMAFYDGQSLASLLRGGPLTSDRALDLVGQVADGLSHTHARGIIHRDIKPANVIVTLSDRIKVIDFGIAKVKNEQMTGTAITGTPAYMAPEQIRGEDPDPRTDIWALGVVLYEAVTGGVPFRGVNTYAQVQSILYDQPHLGPELPESVRHLLERMLAKSPRDRFASMTDVLAAVREALGLHGDTGTLSLFRPEIQAAAVRPDDRSPTVSIAERSSERRQVTAVVCGLADFGAIVERLDPEDLHELLLAYQRKCAAVARELDGHVASTTEDEAAIFFGFPVAHEDDGRRAIRAALAVVEAVQGLDSRVLGTTLQAVIGIHTGTIIAGDALNSAPGSGTIGGNVVHVGRKARDAGTGNQIVVTADTYRIIRRGYTCEPIGSLPVRGAAGALGLFRVVGAAVDDDGAAAGAVAELVGRDGSIEELTALWRQSCDGAGHAVLLSGEPGIGKSRLVASIRQLVGRESAIRLECHCSPYHVNSALHPFIELMRRQFGLNRGTLSDGEKLDRLRSYLTGAGVSAPIDVALLASLLSMPATAEVGATQLAPSQRKARTLSAILRMLTGLASTQPVLLVIEDLHWMDPTSHELVAQLIDRAPANRLMTLMTFRPEFTPPWPDSPHLARVSLNRLAAAHTRALALRVAGKPLPNEVLDKITVTTDGVPLFVEELTKNLIESGALVDRGDRYELKAPLRFIEVPSTVKDSLTARLDRLPTAKQVAQLASVLGREFPYQWLAAVSTLSAPALQQELARLVSADLLHQRGVAPLAVFTFKHALVKDAAYQSLLKTDRQQWHQRIADALAGQFPDVARTQPELIARHYAEAAHPDAAARHWQLAGQRAVEQSHNVEAVAHLTLGIEALRATQPSVERGQRELAMQIPRAAALRATHGFAAPSTGEAYTDARRLAVEAGDQAALVTALNGLFGYHVVRAHYAEALPAAEALLKLGEELKDETHQMAGHRAVGGVRFHTGHPELGRQHLERSLAFYDVAVHAPLAVLLGTDHAETSMSFLSLAQWVLGRPDQALATQQGSLAHSEQLAHRHTIAQALTYLCLVHLLRRESGRVHYHADRLEQLSEEHSFPLMAATARFWRGWAIADAGDHTAGIDQMTRAATAWWATGAQMLRAFAETLMGGSCVAAGDLTTADYWLSESAARLEKDGERWAEAEQLRFRGEWAWARGDHASAVDYYRAAVACADRQGAVMWRLRSATSLARALDAGGHGAEARAALEPVLSEVTEGSATRDLQEARRLLE